MAKTGAPPRNRPERTVRVDRRVAIGGELLDPGRHVLRLGMPADARRAASSEDAPGSEREVSLGVVVGRRRGPRAFVIGGTLAQDGSGLAVARGVVEAIDPDALAGSVLALGLADAVVGAAGPTLLAADDADS